MRRRVPRFSTLLIVSGALLLLAAQAAMAAAPRDSKRLIVPGVSIGSVGLGQAPRAARAAWGGGKCHNPGPYENGESTVFDPDFGPGVCTFNARRKGGAGFKVSQGSAVVRSISLHAWLLRVRTRVSGRGLNTRVEMVPTFAFAAPYTSFRTAKGIKVGSTATAFRAAYPKARRVRDGDGIRQYSFKEYVIKQGNTRTVFELAGGRVAGIDMELIEL